MIRLAQEILSILSPREKRIFYVLILGLTFAGLLEAIGIGFVWPLINLMGNPDYLDKFAPLHRFFVSTGINSHLEKIFLLSMVILAFSIFKSAFVVWINKKGLEFTYNNQGYYGVRLLKSYMQKPYLFHVNMSSSTLIRNVTDGVNCTYTNVVKEYFHLLAEVLTGLLIWLMLVYMDWFTAIVVAGFFTAILYVTLRAIRKKSYEVGKDSGAFSAAYYKWLSQGLRGIKETKIAHKEDFFVNQFAINYKKYTENNKVRYLLSTLPRSVIESVVLVGLVVLIVVKLVFGDNPVEIVPLLGVLALAAFRLMPCVNRSIISLNEIRYGLPLFRLVYPDIVDIVRKNQLEKGTGQEQPLAFTKAIEIKDLTFAYDEQGPIWEHVSFTIKKGDFMGIIGPSGAGKTTFVDAFLGLLTPTAGTITVDGVNVCEHLWGWQSKLSYVAQNIFLIDGTVAENVAFGETPETMDYERIRKVLDMAELLSVIDNLPDGIQTYIGENGVKLSGGQRQRIGIARALYQNPEILVLDEATSALDDTTENAITETLLKLKGRITIVAIAHRLSTLDDCDFKVEFARGRARIV